MSETKIIKQKWNISRTAQLYGLIKNGQLMAIVNQKELAEKIKIILDDSEQK